MWIFSWLPDYAFCIVETYVGFPQPPQGPPSVSWGFCALVSSHLSSARLMCSFSPPDLPPVHCMCWRGSYASPLLVPQPAVCVVGFLWASLSRLSPPSGWGHSLQAVHGLRSATFSVFCPLISCFAQFSKTSQLPFEPACKGAVHRNSSCFRTPSLPQSTSSHSEVLSLFPFYDAILSFTSFQGA